MSTVTRKRRKTVERGCLTGTGDTLTEAKADLSRQIDAALEGYYTPTVLAHKGHIAIVMRDPSGWFYLITDTERLTADGARTGMSSCHGDWTRAECLENAAAHILDTREWHDEADIPAFLTDPARRRDLVRVSRWNRAYLHARDNGLGAGDNEWRRWAGDNERDPRFA